MGEDWFEPVLNIHTPLSPTVTPIFAEGHYFISQIPSFLQSDRFTCLEAELHVPLLQLTVSRSSRAVT